MLYCYCHLQDDLKRLKEQYPGFQVKTIGNSCLGNPIYAFALGTGSKKVFYSGAMHANESITAKLLMLFAERVLQWPAGAGKKIPFRDRATLWIVPMVNPDGVELVCHGLESVTPEWQEAVVEINDFDFCFDTWKANIHGIDLNDQFPACWEEEVARRDADRPGPANFPGTRPLSEPEAIALAEFTLAQEFDLAIAWHSQGEEIYWGYRGFEPPESKEIAEKMAKSSGYTAIQNVESDAGYKDWFLMRFGKPAFTIECGLGVNPLPVEDATEILKKTWGILTSGY
ncbi:MAG: M14 family metallocarboxypeptidase [Peptococcaceae bacterium]|nr:M14 family metallocarboxypeptidase [Peptococcaceae bacterium]